MKATQILISTLATVLLISGVFLSEASANNFKAGMNRVEFKSEGTKIVGTLFLPANYKKGDKLPAIIVDGPWTQVKEQVGYRYAQEFAKNGFAALAFDHRFWGESGGEPRFFESPKAKIADLRNAISFLQTVPAIDTNKIGGLGVCFGASYLVLLAAEEPRLKSFATVAAWLHDNESIRKVYGAEGYETRMTAGENALKNFEQNKKIDYVLAYSATDSTAAMFSRLDYYSSPARGAIPAWKNQFAQMSWVDWLKLDTVAAPAAKIKAPVLFVHSDNSALPDNVKRLYNSLDSPKELYWTSGNHLDFYDKDKEVNDAVQALTKHFKNTLTGKAAENSKLAK
jgi:hypothetical protein